MQTICTSSDHDLNTCKVSKLLEEMHTQGTYFLKGDGITEGQNCGNTMSNKAGNKVP